MDLSDRCPCCQMPLSAFATHCPHCTQDISGRWYQWGSPAYDDGAFRLFAAGICSAIYVLSYMIASGQKPGRSLLVALATAFVVWIGLRFMPPAIERKMSTLIVMPAFLAVCWAVVRYVLPFLFEIVSMIWNS
ncbi:MAG TPA: hypothetical protein VFW73_04405 [Lacipirellulaceae bacterium]|nr:hypothetical protein [Lacipirellulaceae bacterium]